MDWPLAKSKVRIAFSWVSLLADYTVHGLSSNELKPNLDFLQSCPTCDLQKIVDVVIYLRDQDI